MHRALQCPLNDIAKFTTLELSDTFLHMLLPTHCLGKFFPYPVGLMAFKSTCKTAQHYYMYQDSYSCISIIFLLRL